MKPKWQHALAVSAMATAIAFAAGCGGDMNNQSPRAAVHNAIDWESVGDNDVVFDVQGLV